MALALHLAADSPFDRQLEQVRIYRGRPDATLDAKGIRSELAALAIDFVVMAVSGTFDVGILMSTDTDMKPALEAVAELTRTRGTRADVAAWSAPGRHDRRLSISSRNLYCHWVGKDTYDRTADMTDYSRPT